MQRTLFRVAAVLSVGTLLASCGGGGGSRSVPGIAPVAPLAPNAASRQAETVVIPPPPGCTPIINVNPATHFPTRTARRFAGGEDFNLDATGCDYGIYLGPNVKHAEIEEAKIHGFNRIGIITEGAKNVRIRRTAVDGGGKIAGIEYTYDSTGSVERSFVTNAETGIEVIFGGRVLIGESYITNTSFLGVNVLEDASAVVEDVYIDNSMNLGSGVAVQLGSKGLVRNVTAIGAGKPTLFGPQFGFFFGYRDPHVEAKDNTAIGNQYGFGAYCVTSIPSVDELTDEHNRARNSTIKNYDVQTSNCAPPPPGT
jgi:Right handed beta helix region